MRITKEIIFLAFLFVSTMSHSRALLEDVYSYWEGEWFITEMVFDKNIPFENISYRIY